MKKETVIIEFNGLPGLGKTTVANMLFEELEKSGYNAIRNYRHSFFHTLHHPFPELYSPKLFKLVSSYAKSIPPLGKKRTHVHWTNFYAQKYESIVKYSDADFAIIDEAIIQFLVAMAFQDRMPVSNKADAIVLKLKSMGIKFVRVDCVNNIENSVNRIMSRPPRGLVFETMDHNELIRTMEIEAANFNYLRSVFSKVYDNQIVIGIDTTVNPNENAQIIKNILIEHFT